MSEPAPSASPSGADANSPAVDPIISISFADVRRVAEAERIRRRSGASALGVDSSHSLLQQELSTLDLFLRTNDDTHEFPFTYKTNVALGPGDHVDASSEASVRSANAAALAAAARFEFDSGKLFNRARSKADWHFLVNLVRRNDRAAWYSSAQADGSILMNQATLFVSKRALRLDELTAGISVSESGASLELKSTLKASEQVQHVVCEEGVYLLPSSGHVEVVCTRWRILAADKTVAALPTHSIVSVKIGEGLNYMMTLDQDKFDRLKGNANPDVGTFRFPA